MVQFPSSADVQRGDQDVEMRGTTLQTTKRQAAGSVTVGTAFKKRTLMQRAPTHRSGLLVLETRYIGGLHRCPVPRRSFVHALGPVSNSRLIKYQLPCDGICALTRLTTVIVNLRPP
jgi:hypothetical protein